MASSDVSADQSRRVIAATVVVAAVITAFAAVYVVGNVVFLLFVGIVLATALKPIIEAIQRCGIRQPVAVAAVYACLALLLIGLTIVGAPPLVSRSREIAGEIPQVITAMHHWLENAGNALWAKVARRLAGELSLDGAPLAPEQSLATVSQTANYLAVVARGLLTSSVVVLLAFYWSLQGDRTVRWLLLLLPVAKRDKVRETIDEIEGKVGAYIRGQGLVCLAMAAMAATIYGLLGIRYGLELGLIAGLFEVMPVLGPVLGAIPPLIIVAFTDPAKTLWVLLAAVLMQQVEGYLIVPRIMDKSVGVHPMVTLLGIAAFGSLFGIPGAILAIPLAAMVQVLLNRYVLLPAASQPDQPSGRGALSVLQYDAQKLLCDIRLRDKAESSEPNMVRLAEDIESIARDLDERLKEAEGPVAEEGKP
jgi:predicted PurR-regulated permease PerM